MNFVYHLLGFSFVALGSDSVALQLAVGSRLTGELGVALGRDAREDVVLCARVVGDWQAFGID